MAATVKIAFEKGPVVRTIEDFEWSEAAGWVQAVPIELAAKLINYPNGGFTLGEQPSAATRKALAEAMGIKPENLVVPDGDAPAVTPVERTVADVTGAARAADLAAAGVASVAQLAALDDVGIEKLGLETGASRSEIKDWADAAKKG